MSEGGLLHWKRQNGTKNNRGPACSYAAIKDPLPSPPEGTAWVYIPQTKEWCVTEVSQSVTGTTEEGVSKGKVDEEASRVASTGYVTHRVESTDTMQGICLKYKVSQTTLRRLNHFSGSNLTLAPHTLILPAPTAPPATCKTGTNDGGSGDQQIHRFLHALRTAGLRSGGGRAASTAALGRAEAIAYLDMNDGDIEGAVRDAMDDIGWEGGGL